MDQVREGLQQMLRAKTAPRTNLSPYPALVEYVEVELAGRVPDDADIGRLALALVVEAALRQGPVGRNDRGEPAHPLRAAKHLLALGEYPEDIHAEVPDTGMSLYAIKNLDPKNPIKADDPRGPHTLGLRAQIAALAGKYGESRGVLLKEGSKRLGEVVGALFDEMRVALEEPKITQKLAKRVKSWEEQDNRTRAPRDLDKHAGIIPKPPPSLNRSPGGSIKSILKSAVDQADRASGHYPSSLRPTRLVGLARVSRTPRRGQPLSEDAIARLYMGNDSHLYPGGTPALPTLRYYRKRAVVLGDAGSGKSTILAARFVDHIQGRAGNVGIYARLSDIGRIAKTRPPKSVSEAVAVVVEAFALWLEVRVDEDVLSTLNTALVDDPSALLVLDGLDEVHDFADRVAAIETLRNLDQVPGLVLVASRFTGYSDLGDSFIEVTVDRLTPEQVKEFLSMWYPSKSSPGRRRVRDALRASPPIRDLMQIPLMAGLIAFVAAREVVPASVSTLYDRCIALFLERRWKDLDGHRHEVSEIADLISLATEIAWSMATRPPIAPSVVPQWTDTATAGELVEIAHHRAGELRQLLTMDGLLGLTGSSTATEPLLYQQYRWLHRNIHEHLVGTRLAQLFRSDPHEAVEFLSAVMQSPASWETCIRHAFGLVSLAERDRVLDGIRVKILQGDPGGFFTGVLQSLERMAKPRSMRSEVLAEPRIRSSIELRPVGGMFMKPLHTDIPTTEVKDSRRLLVSMAKRDLTETDCAQLETLVYAMSQRKSTSAEFVDSLRLMSRLRPDDATRIAIEHAHQMPNSNIPSEWYRGLVASQEVLDGIHRAAYGVEFPNNMQLVRLLHAFQGEPEPLAESDFRDHPHYCLATLSGEWVDAPPLAVPDSFIEQVVAGRYGDWAAFDVAQQLSLSRLKEFQLCAWAEVVCWTKGIFQNASFRELDVSDSSEAVSRLRGFSNENLSDPIAMIQLWRAVHAGLVDRTLEPLAALINLWSRASEFVDVLDESGWPESPSFHLDDFRTWLHIGIIPSNNWERVWPALRSGMVEIGTNTAEIGRLARNSIPKGAVEGDSQVDETCRWGAQVGLPLLSAIPLPKEPTKFVSRLLTNIDANYLAEPSNLDAIVGWLRAEGSLPIWRDRLLALSEQSSAR